VLDPVSVVAGNNGNSGIFVSSGGALVASRGGTKSQISWIARDGSPTPITKEARNYENPRLAPDGERIAVVVSEQDKSDIWTYDMGTGTHSRLTSVTAASSPSWSSDGSKIYFVGMGDKERFAIWSQAADGGSRAEKVAATRALTTDVVIAPDGRSLLYTAYNDNSWDIFRIELDSARASVPYLTESYNEFSPSFSPDGRWLAMASNESGGTRSEIYVRSYPNPSSKIQISAGGGRIPAWSADGTRVFYSVGSIGMSARLSFSPNPRVVARDTVMTSSAALVGGGNGSAFTVAKDGRLLSLALKKDDYQLVVVPNWRAELERRLAGAAR
jgi:Tol biopolymer transport system component